METTVVEADEFRALEGQWNELAAADRSPLLRHEFCAAFVEVWVPPGNLRILVGRKGNEITAIAPLCVERVMGAPRLVCLPKGLGEPAGFLGGDDPALADLVDRLAGGSAPCRLPRLESAAPEARLLAEALNGKGRGRHGRALARARAQAGLVRVPLYREPAEFEHRMSARRRGDLRRYWRRAERMGEVEFQPLTPDEPQAKTALAEMFRVESSGWKGRAGSGILLDPRRQRFYTACGLAAARLGMLRLYFLRIGGRLAAARMAVEHADRLWDLKIGYDEAFAACSPGMLLTHQTLRHAGASGLRAHEFLGRREDWEDAWPNEVRGTTSFWLYPASPAGLAWLGIDAARHAARRMLQHRRAPPRRPVRPDASASRA